MLIANLEWIHHSAVGGVGAAPKLFTDSQQTSMNEDIENNWNNDLINDHPPFLSENYAEIDEQWTSLKRSWIP